MTRSVPVSGRVVATPLAAFRSRLAIAVALRAAAGDRGGVGAA